MANTLKINDYGNDDDNSITTNVSDDIDNHNNYNNDDDNITARA